MINPPRIDLTVVEQTTIPDNGFLRVCRSKTIFTYPNGDISEPFVLDHVTRQGFDAVVIVAHYYDNSRGPMIYLRSAIRPAISLRDYAPSKILEEEAPGNLWELPAGLIDSTELGVEGARQAAVRELEEELGFVYEHKEMKLLGKRVFSCAGIAGERLFFFQIEVDPSKRKEPTLDGSPFEKHGVVVAVPLFEAIKMVDDGYLPDGKTESVCGE